MVIQFVAVAFAPSTFLYPLYHVDINKRSDQFKWFFVRNLLINRLRTKIECSTMSHSASTKTRLFGGEQILQDISCLGNVGAMIAESRSILDDDQSSKTQQRYAFKKLDLVQNALLVLQENVAQNVLKSVHVGGFLQASNRKQNVEKRKSSNTYEWLTPSNRNATSRSISSRWSP
jgi:hypothetical protein